MNSPRSTSSSRAASQVPAEVQAPRILLLLAVLALLLIGLVMVYSASSANLIGDDESPYHDVISQALYALIGIAVAVVLWKLVPYRVWFGRVSWVLWGISIVLLLLTWLIGTGDEEYGARRWLYFGPVGGQPSEFVKIALLIVAIRIFLDAKDGVIEGRAALAQAIVLVLIPVFFLYKTQSDLGTSAICAVGILAVLWLGGVSWKVIAGILVLAVVFLAYSIFGTDYRSGRMVYLNPWNDGDGGLGDGYNIIRSYFAFAEGGIFGVGLGNSHEKYQYLFASESDFIFAVIGEELGMVGALAVVALYLVVLYAGLRIAHAAADEAGMLIAGGCTIMLVFQAFLNMGCAIGVFPTTGKPLPFISSGGTSVVASLMMVGLILAVSHAQSGPSIYEQRRADLRIVRAQGARGASPGTSSRTSSSARRGRGDDRLNTPYRVQSAQVNARSSAALVSVAHTGRSSFTAGERAVHVSHVSGRRLHRGVPSSDFARIEMPRRARR